MSELPTDKLREAKTRLQNLEKHMAEGFVQPGDPWHTAYLALNALLLITELKAEDFPHPNDGSINGIETKLRGAQAVIDYIQKIIGGLDAA